MECEVHKIGLTLNKETKPVVEKPQEEKKDETKKVSKPAKEKETDLFSKK